MTPSRIAIALLCTGVFLLAGCGGAREEYTTATPIPTYTPFVASGNFQPTATPRPAPAASPTGVPADTTAATPLPTAASEPTEIPASAVTLAPTEVPETTELPGPTATHEPTATSEPTPETSPSAAAEPTNSAATTVPTPARTETSTTGSGPATGTVPAPTPLPETATTSPTIVATAARATPTTAPTPTPTATAAPTIPSATPDATDDPPDISALTDAEIYAGLPPSVADAMAVADAENGRALTITQACSACHSMEEAVRIVGPSWYNLANEALTRVEGQGPALYLYNSIVHPNDYINEGYPANVMLQTYGDTLNDQQLADIVAYLLTLRGDE